MTPDSWLTVQRWAEAFLARLRAHHALNAEPLSTTAFEAAFNAACDAADWEVHPADSATNRFFDTRVVIPGRGDVKLSLKASSAKNMIRPKVHISKLTEAAWIQDARTKVNRRDQIVQLFREYRAQTDSIVMLRCFRLRDSDSLLYELVEIPTALFEPVDELTITQAQATTIPVPSGAETPNLSIRIDRSDAKITITGIRIEVCTVHGTWEVPNLSGVHLPDAAESSQGSLQEPDRWATSGEPSRGAVEEGAHRRSTGRAAGPDEGR